MSRRQQINKIHSLLQKLDGNEPLTEEQMIKYDKSLFEAIDACLPEYLYKYRAVDEYSIDNFRNNKIYINDPSRFNDPTDSMAYVDPDVVMGNILGFGRIIVESDFDENHMINISPEEDLLNRVRMGNTAISTINYIRSRVKVACFSENIESSLMWSHYANYHRGFALRYRIKGFSLGECAECKEDMICHRKSFPFYPVIYKDTRFNVSKYAVARALYKDTFPEEDERFIPVPLIPLLQKGTDWKYEEEWRVLCHDLNKEHIIMEADALYLGEQISGPDALTLVKIAREKKISIYKMKIDFYDPKFVLGYDDWTEYDDKAIMEMLPEPREWYGE